MGDACIRLWPSLPLAKIRPEIYGHFAEHLGRCIYEGIWVGPEARIPNQRGLRLDVLAALKHLRAPVLRWPGGCFADDYHWRDGVGPVEKRPQRVNLWWREIEPNSFGTDEFLLLCSELGCAPYLCCNVGSGTPQEARDWLEYCTFGGDSMLAALRAKHGHPEPYDIKYWGVGNENWGCGGGFHAREYAAEYRRFACYLRALCPDMELVACGAGFGDYSNDVQNTWNHELCDAVPEPHGIDHLALHRYFARGTATGFSDAEHRALLADVCSLERDLELTEAVLRYFYPDRHVGIAIDEWGVWHPCATQDNGLEQPNTLRDALLAGAVLNCLNRWAHRVTMANIAQTINVLQCLAKTDGARMYLTPTYHVFDMMRPHMGARLLTQEVDGPTYEAHPVGLRNKRSVPLLSVSASAHGRKLLLTVVNASVDEDVPTRIDVREARIGAVSGRVLDGPDVRAENTFDAPKTVVAKRVQIGVENGELAHTFPAHSCTALSITLE